MGMYTSIQWCDLEPLHSEKSFNLMLDWLKQDVPDYIPEGEVENYRYLKDKMLKAYEDCTESYKDHPSFATRPPKEHEYLYDVFIYVFDGLKLMGYWCDDFGYFIRDLAQFVEGEVRLVYEGNEEFAILNFKGGDLQIQLGEVMFDDPVHMSDIFRIPELPEKELIRRQL